VPGVQTNFPSFRFNFGVVSVFKYGIGTGSGDVIDDKEMTNNTVAVPVSFKLSVTVKLVLVVPAAVAVPLIRPAVERVNPAGRAEFELTVAIFVPVPPLRVRFTGVIAVPTLPVIRAGPVIIGRCGAREMTNSTVAVAVSFESRKSVAVKMILVFPAVVGVPII
jgi:hypothetical protein